MTKTALFWILFLTVGLPFVLYNVARDFIRWRRDKRRAAGVPPFVSPAAPVVVPTVAPKVGGESPPPRISGVTTPRGFPARTPDDDNEQGEE